LRRIEYLRRYFGRSGGSTLAFAPDGKSLALWGHDHGIRLWDVSTGEERNASEAHRERVRSVAFAPDGRTLATGGDGMALRLWQHTGKPLRSWVGPNASCALGVAFSADGKRLAFPKQWRAYDGECYGVHLLEVASLSDLPALESKHPPDAVAFSPVGGILAASTVSGAIYLWDAGTGKELRRLEADQGFCLAFSEDGAFLASGGGGSMVDPLPGSVHLWDPATGKKLHHLRLGGSWVSDVAFAPGGWAVASASDDGTLCLWETTTGQQRRRWSGGTYVTISPDGRLIAAGGAAQHLQVWEPATGAC